MRNPIRRRADQRGSARSSADLEARLVWVLGSSRSGSTWLLNLLAADRRVIAIDEPGIGAHLGVFASGLAAARPHHVPADRLRLNDLRRDAPSYLFSRRYEAVWRPLVRDLVLGRLGPEIGERARSRGISDPIVVLKEPNGAQGADVLMASLPRSRLLFLLRDGRDVVDSDLDAATPGSWAASVLEGYTGSERDREAFVRERAHVWLSRTWVVQRAYEDHPPELRRLVRYEDLLADTAPVLRDLMEWLDLDLDEEAMDAAVAKLSFDRVAERGPGRFARAATPGLWRRNLSAAEQEALDEILGSTLRELGY